MVTLLLSVEEYWTDYPYIAVFREFFLEQNIAKNLSFFLMVREHIFWEFSGKKHILTSIDSSKFVFAKKQYIEKRQVAKLVKQVLFSYRDEILLNHFVEKIEKKIKGDSISLHNFMVLMSDINCSLKPGMHKVRVPKVRLMRTINPEKRAPSYTHLRCSLKSKLQESPIRKPLKDSLSYFQGGSNKKERSSISLSRIYRGKYYKKKKSMPNSDLEVFKIFDALTIPSYRNPVIQDLETKKAQKLADAAINLDLKEWTVHGGTLDEYKIVAKMGEFGRTREICNAVKNVDLFLIEG